MLFGLANMLIAGIQKLAGDWADIILGPAANTVSGGNGAVTMNIAGTIVFGYSSFVSDGGNGSVSATLNGVSQGALFNWSTIGGIVDKALSVTFAAGDTVAFTTTTTYAPGGNTQLAVIVYNSATGGVIDTFLVDLTTT